MEIAMRFYREFEGGYAHTRLADAVLSAAKAKRIGKIELRLFFAQLERQEAGDRVPVEFLLNGERPLRRIGHTEQDAASKCLQEVIQEFAPANELTTKVPRKFARAAARGAFNMSVMLAALFFFRWRKPQRRRRSLLQRGERYASFTYEQARTVTGLARCTLCGAFQTLRRLGVIAVTWRPMQQIKRFGMLFVDGEKLNLYCKKPERLRGSNPWKRLQKTRTVPAENQNANRLTLPKNSFCISAERKERLTDTLTRLRNRFCMT